MSISRRGLCPSYEYTGYRNIASSKGFYADGQSRPIEVLFDIDTFDAKLLMDTFTDLTIDKERIKARMAEELAIYKGALTSQFDQLFPLKAAK